MTSIPVGRSARTATSIEHEASAECGAQDFWRPKMNATRSKLLITVSAGALLLSGAALAQDRSGAPLFGSRGGGSTSDPAAAAANAALEQATRQAQTNSATQRAIEAFRQAAQTRAAMQDAQVQARAAAKAAQSLVPNGLNPGGLQVAGEIAIDPSLWLGAKSPTQTTGTDGRTSVLVEQTQQKAILTWDSFNVGRDTDLAFRQDGTDWVVLNRVRDINPSRIEGTIKAPGTVLILNQNGVLFSGTSQVNVRNLVAAAATMSDDQFLNRGIYSQVTGANYAAAFANAGGAVRVEAGAQINTAAPTSVTAGGGYVMLLGKEVTNTGSITTPRGQTLLAAGDNFLVRAGVGTEANQYSTTRGNEVRSLLNADSSAGSVVNNGLIEATQGDITLTGRTVRQEGVALATTSVNQRGSIHLSASASDTKGSVTLGKDGLTIILPELDSKDTALDAQRDAIIAESSVQDSARQQANFGQFDTLAKLQDRRDQSRVEIVSGGNVLFEGGSQTSAQGGQVSVQANAGRITVADGARIDVSGVMGVALDMESNSIKVNVQGNELRDSPQNRDTAGLKSQDVWVDVRDLVLLPSGTGGYEGDRWYTPGGLLEVGGWLGNTAHSIGEWSAVGGTITLAAKEVVAEKGAVFDLSGGSLDYQGGYIRSTRVMGADGKLYDIAQAPAGMAMLGYGNVFVRKHERWGDALTQSWSDKLFSGRESARWEDGYSVGRDGGRLILSAPTVLFDADILAETITGGRQHIARPSGTVTDGYKLGQNQAALAGGLILGNYNALGLLGGFNSDVRIADGSLMVGLDDPVAPDQVNTAWFDGERLSSFGLGRIELNTSVKAVVDADLTMANGGQFSITAPNTDISAKVTAHGGDITLTNVYRTQSGSVAAGQGSIVLHDGAALDVSGKWTNAFQSPDDLSGLAFLDGGTVNIRSTQDVVLEEGSLIDVSSGAALLADGSLAGGRGGDVSLIADIRFNTTANNSSGSVVLDGTLKANGVLGGGTLTIEGGPGIVIGGGMLAENGTLSAGETSLVDLTTTEAITVRMGDTLPADFGFTKTRANPGEQIGGAPNFSAASPVTLAAAWQPPQPAVSSYTIFFTDGTAVSVFSGASNTPPTIAAGKTIRSIDAPGLFPKDYVLPANAFPNGIAIQPSQAIAKAGTPAPVDATIAAGARIPAGTRVASPVRVQKLQYLDTSLFQQGFSNYVIDGHQGLAVLPGTKIEGVSPVYRLKADGFDVATGARPDAGLELWTPPVYQEDAVNDRFVQRTGTNIQLNSNASTPFGNTVGSGGSVVIGTQAEVTVDPGSRIAIGTTGTIFVDGRLTASGGNIDLIQSNVASLVGVPADPLVGQRAITVGEHAVLDVAARAVTATGRDGLRYALVPDGGSITIGAPTLLANPGSIAQAAEAFIVIKQGAVLDASGASAVIDLPRDGGLGDRSTPLTLASNGGTIALNSFYGLYLDGTMRANAGGAGAMGGSLILALETPRYRTSTAQPLIPDDVRYIRELVIGQDYEASGSGGPLQTGTARISVEQIDAGGFDNFTAYADVLRFDGNVDLAVGNALSLYPGINATDGSDMAVRLAADYVLLSGSAYQSIEGNPIYPKAGGPIGTPSTRPTSATLTVDADFLDVVGLTLYGVKGSVPLSSGSRAFDYAGFDKATLNSRGDIRMRGSISGAREMDLNAAQIYPEGGGTIMAKDLVRIGRIGDLLPAMPYSAFGTLGIYATEIEQGGILRAPLGRITLGTDLVLQNGAASAPIAEKVTLLPGSITSVSGNGLMLPYGGTIDGITYMHGAGTVTGSIDVLPGVTLGGKAFEVQEGALIDLSGGGDLLGAGFTSGRGGSVDVLTTALANANPAYALSASGNEVYAIVPGVQNGYAPLDTTNGAIPEVGRQITIPDGVPGLKAGTYTLMPARYAMLPGAYRVELGARQTSLAGGAIDAGAGTWVVQGYQGLSTNGYRDALPTQMLISSGTAVRTQSQYNEMRYDQFLVADAAKFGAPQPVLPRDAHNLYLRYALQPSATEEALRFDGEADFTPGQGGQGGSLFVTSAFTGMKLEILADDAAANTGFTSLRASDLNGIGAQRMALGGNFQLFSDTNQLSMRSFANSVTVREGAVLAAPEILLLATNGGVTIEDGATVTTIGKGADTPYSAGEGYAYAVDLGVNALILSNGVLNLNSRSGAGTGGGGITIGDADLLTEGTLAFATNTGGKLTLGDGARYGAKYLSLVVPTINIGEESALADAVAAGVLPDGLVFNQKIFADLLRGNVAPGVPKVETLILSASGSVNFFGSVTLDTIDPTTGKSSLAQLVLNTPGIYGLGGAGDTATLTTGALFWNGVSDGKRRDTNSEPGSLPPAAVIPGGAGTGSGKLHIIADRIEFGYEPFALADTQLTLDRTVLGFSEVDLTAADRITSNSHNRLSVYQSKASDGSFSGGNLNLVTPLLTGEGASVTQIAAGGNLLFTSPQGTTPAANDVLGAEISLKGSTVTIDGTVSLPTGKLSVEADGNVLLTDHAQIDLSGRAVEMFDVTKYSWGGDLVLASANGDIRQAAGSKIDLSAENNAAGTLAATATGAGAGLVDLVGTILGSASGEHDAGGTMVPWLGGQIDIRAQTIADFTGLNQRLSNGEMFGARGFQIKQGDLVIGDELKANSISVSVDGGSLTVTGKVDASGAEVGTIRLGARDGLILAPTAVLDAHGTMLRVDSRGQPIDSPNRAIVELTATSGRLTLAPGATIDVRSADGIARGTVTLNAPRLTETGGDIDIDASGTVTIDGAKSVAVNGFWRYTDAPAGTPGDDGKPIQTVDQTYLDAIHGKSTAFMNAAFGNDDLQGRLAGLRAYGDAYHLRPGVEIASATSDGNLVVTGDIDLSGYRYGPGIDPAVRGSGEPGALLLRAGGDLTIKGSINDGFAPPSRTPDDNGWGVTGLLAEDFTTTIPTLLQGSAFGNSTTLPFSFGQSFGFDITARDFSVPVGLVIPFEFVASDYFEYTDADYNYVPWRATAPIWDADGNLLYAAGDMVTDFLQPDFRFGAGTVLPVPLPDAAFPYMQLPVGSMTIPKGTPIDFVLPNTNKMVLAANVTVAAGTVIPRGTTVRGILSTRPTLPDGTQGKMWAVAPMLEQGTQSWSMRLAGGADLAAADTRSLNAARTGDLILSDPHFTGPAKTAEAPSVIRTGTGDLELQAGGDFTMSSLYGVYTAGTQSAPILADDGSNPYNQPRGLERTNSGAGTSVLGSAGGAYESLVSGGASLYQAWYPEQGGNLLVEAQGDLSSYNLKTETGDWLWRQGGDLSGLPAAWWINFGTYVPSMNPDGAYNPFGSMRLAAFTGFGALGGGDVVIRAGGDAGVITPLNAMRSHGVSAAVGGSGRITAGDQLVQTGGGDLSFTVGGTLNPLDANLNPGSNLAQNTFWVRGQISDPQLNGVLANLRGMVTLDAGAIGRLDLGYGTTSPQFKPDPRPIDLNEANGARPNGGPQLVLGDAVASLTARGDLVLSHAANAGRVPVPNSTPFTATVNGVTTVSTGGGYAWFSLWTDHTAVEMFSAGGNLQPYVTNTGGLDSRFDFPGTLQAVAPEGNIYYGMHRGEFATTTAMVLAPVPNGQLEILAGGSIYALGSSLDMSGADPSAIPTPFRPAFMGYTTASIPSITNLSSAGEGVRTGLAFYAFGPNSVSGNLHAGDDQPIRFYAVGGDLMAVRSGEVLDFTNGGSVLSPKMLDRWYIGAKPVWMLAGRDIVSSGAQPQIVINGKPLYEGGRYGSQSTSALFFHTDADDVSVIRAGRDILQLGLQVAGPGTLDLSAGRNFYQADKGSITSIGALVAGDTRPGASIVAAAGVGATGPDYAAIAAPYLDPANLADPERPLADQAGKVAKTYQAELGDWLDERYGFTGTDAEALTYFAGLSSEQRAIFLRQVYYAELKAGGREYNNPDSRRFQSYLRGRDMIATLFPEKDAQGNAIVRQGDITMFGGSGIRTLFGGDIQFLAPGGQIVLGVEGAVPPATAGVATQGEGDIAIYSKGSLLLGLSRLMTTFGGGILGWSAEGDINAGRGARTTILFTPPRRTYDKYGNVQLAPQVPSSGAGIATLNPIPEVAPGDIDLIAPLGTIDAGEAGIRVSGNVNLAALQVLNAANIQVQGEATGIPVAVSVNTGALTSASSVSSAVANQAAQLAERARPQVRTEVPVIVQVRLLGFGENP